ncbi:MAG: hypothetical protein IPK58_16700 [Acidobacteria bacterium]|nr:hypothetical protein [Acidobacteriota bacterium]
MPAIEALEIIGREGVNQLPVVENGKLKESFRANRSSIICSPASN